MEAETPSAEKTLNLLRSRLCSPSFIFSPLKSSPDSNYSKLKFLISNSLTEGCNTSVLLLGPRGCGKSAVLELVLGDLQTEYADMISVVRLNGLLHSDDTCSLKEVARQLCMEHHLLFSKMASSDDNSEFMIDMLRECGLAHKTIIFVLDEFDLFTQGKQRLLYSLLDAMQSLSSQAVVIGLSCRLDADQLLEKRVRSRFSHRKLLFDPPPIEELHSLLVHILSLPTDSTFPHKYSTEFNSRLHMGSMGSCTFVVTKQGKTATLTISPRTETEELWNSKVRGSIESLTENLLGDKKFSEVLNSLLTVDNSVGSLLRFLFQAVCFMDPETGFLAIDNFRNAISCIRRQPKQENLQDASVLELYILVCMNRLEAKEQSSYNFNVVMKEYKAVHDNYQTSDYYAQNVCLRAFEHLLDRGLIGFTDSKGRSQSIEFRPVRLLIAPQELYQGLKSNRSCPAILQKLFDHESYK